MVQSSRKSSRAPNERHVFRRKSSREPRQGRVVSFSPKGLPWLHADIPVDVPGVLPGELIRYEELGRGRHRARGRLLEVIEPHPERVEPTCAIAARCGSCDRIMVSSAGQLTFKRESVQQALLGVGWAVPPVHPSPRKRGYRSRLKLTFFGRAGALRLGAFMPGSHWLIELGACPVAMHCLLEARDRIVGVLSELNLEPFHEKTGQGVLRHLVLQADPESQAVMAILVIAEGGHRDWSDVGRALLSAGDRGGIRGVCLSRHPGKGNAILGAEIEWLAGLEGLTVRVNEVRLRYVGGAFSQVNLDVAAQMYAQVAEWARAAGEGGMLDLYCGVGALAMIAGREAEWGIGLESNPRAVAAARASAEELRLSRWRFEVGDVGSELHSRIRPGSVAVAFVNPPRRGLTTAVPALLKIAPRQLIYVSCNPWSLAQDLRKLLEGGYRIKCVQAYDMFPHTRHVETLVQLRRAT